MLDPILEPVITHLEFVGYSVTRKEQYIAADHPNRFKVTAREMAGGIMFTCYFGGSDFAKGDMEGFLNHVNALNNDCIVARIYVDDESDFCIEAWYPGSYDRKSFGQFLELWDHDCALVVEDEGLAEYLE